MTANTNTIPPATERPIRLIALDLDGTTLQDDHLSLHRRNREAIREAIRRGIAVVPATGRDLHGLPLSIRRIPGIRYAITSNGACVTDLAAGGTIYASLIPKETAAEILLRMRSLGVYAEACRGGVSYVQRGAKMPVVIRDPLFRLLSFLTRRKRVPDLAAFVREGGDVEKLELLPESAALRERIEAELAPCGLAVTSSGLNTIEISNRGISKGNALERLCTYLGLGREEVMAVGDNLNDLEMIGWAGLGVCVANAAPALKKAADFVTFRNTEAGVAHVIEQFALR